MSQNLLQAVEGPLDYGDIWRGRIGQDWKRRPPVYAPLIRNRQLDQFVHLRSDILTNVSFFEVLGQGAFGKVWKVTAYLKIRENYPFDPIWKKFTLACKIIRHSDSTEQIILDSLNEMRILRYFRHKNICNLIEIIGIPDQITNFPYSKVVIFFELCDGNLQQLIDKIRRGQTKYHPNDYVLPERLSRHWFAQMAKAIQYLHSNGVVHRDVHTGNILYCGPNQIYQYDDHYFLSSIFKLADFGLSKDVALTPDVYKWTVERHNFSQKFDIGRLTDILYNTGVPGIKGRSFAEKKMKLNTFMDYCKTGQSGSSFSMEWLKISPAMRDLLYKLRKTNEMTAENILRHQWLQENDEPRTEPFILREHQINLEGQPSHSQWEEAIAHPFLNPDFESLFGMDRHQYNQLEPMEQREEEE